MLLGAYVNFGGYLSIICVILLLKLKLYKVITLLLYFIMMSVTVFIRYSLSGGDYQAALCINRTPTCSTIMSDFLLPSVEI
jgi:hypothetical protein